MKQLSIDRLIKQICQHPNFSQVGMIACHLGIVRGTSRNGQPISQMEVKLDLPLIHQIINQQKKQPGIVEILFEGRQGCFQPGESLMAVVVAGDIREHVFATLEDTVNLIKQKATTKREIKSV